MPTRSSDNSAARRGDTEGLHRERPMAESFGLDADGYDRARPGYPDDLIRRITNGLPGRSVLDVGCGTGIAARQLRSVGCTVLGVEPDHRMAVYARTHGLGVEVATFEDWDPAGRTFDLVVAAQSWHWVEPAAGAAKAAAVLGSGGRLAVFGHVFEPPAPVAAAFAEAFSRVVPESPFAQQNKPGGPPNRALEAYRAGYAVVADTINDTGLFAPAESAQFDWEQTYSRDEWLRLLPTTGGLTRLDPERRQEILAPVGRAIDDLGGHFTMAYVTLLVSAERRPR